MKIALFAALILMASASFAAIPIDGGILNVEMAKYDPAPAEAGSLVTVWFDIDNIGIEEIGNASFAIIPEYPFSLPNGDMERRYGRITGLDDIRLEYKVLVNKLADNGTYSLKIKYSNEGRIFTEKSFTITVSESREEADLEALFVRSEPVAFQVRISKLTIDIINANSGTAYYTLVKASSEAAVIDRDSIFVGTLEGNDFDSVDFDMKIKNIEPGVYPVTLQMSYKDKDSNEIVENSTVYVMVGSLEEYLTLTKNEFPVWLYVAYLLALVVVLRIMVPFFRWLVRPLRKK